jgi:hypothetical protein
MRVNGATGMGFGSSGALIVVILSAPPAAAAAGVPWTDALTAVGTVGATTAAVLGLLLNQQSAKRDRRTAARELKEERERAAEEADRHYLQSTLSLVTESFASYQTYGADDERGQMALRKLRVYLNALPDDMATLVRHELGIARTTTSEQVFLSFANERGWTLDPNAVQRGVVEPAAHWAYEELADNSARIAMSTPPSRGRRRADSFRPRNPDL